MSRFWLMLGILGYATPALAQRPGDQPALSLTEVLASSASSHPSLAKGQARVEQRLGQQLAARGAFDPKAKAYASGLPAGYYNYVRWAASIEQTLPSGGMRVRSGYRQTLGDIPSYRGEYATLDRGELFADVSVPLLANRSIDEERARLQQETAGVAEDRYRLAATGLKIARDTTVAYWKWVAAGQKLRVIRDLTAIAIVRAGRIRTQAERGSRPGIDVIDADRVAWSRQSDTLAVERDFALAQAGLSLYFRDSQRQPVTVPLERVPLERTLVPVDTGRLDDWVAEALRNRPELRALELADQRARIDLRLARNQKLPTLDARMFVARDMGAGDSSLGDTDFGVGLTFSWSLRQRRARGQAAAARAKRAAIEAERRGLRDRIIAELRARVREVELARERAELAQQRLQAVEVLARGERTRVQQGASDLLRLDLREIDVARAAREAIDATLEHNRAVAALLFTRGLGLAQDVQERAYAGSAISVSNATVEKHTGNATLGDNSNPC